MTKCGFCGKELPEPGCDTIMVVEFPSAPDTTLTCVNCQRSGKRKIVRLRKVPKTTEGSV